MTHLKQCLLACFALFLLPTLEAQDTLSPEDWQEDLRFLQEAIHKDFPFLFKKISAEEFDQAVETFHASIPELETHEILVGMTRMVAQFQYGHTVLGYWEQKVPIHALPVVLYHYDDGIYLQGIHKDYASLAGAKLLAIEGMTIEEVLERMRPVVPAENEMFVIFACPGSAPGAEAGNIPHSGAGK